MFEPYAAARRTNHCGVTAEIWSDAPNVFTLVALTPCCKASGKGGDSPTGVVCRACYRPVSAKYGTSGWESLLQAARDAKCPCPSECADWLHSVLWEDINHLTN